MSILIDIKSYDPKRDTFEDYGYSIVPLLQTLNTDADEETIEYYVNSGHYALPIYKGKIQQQTVDILLSSTNPISVLQNSFNQGGIQLAKNSACIVKILDTQRKFHLRGKLDEQTIDYRFMPDNLKK